MVMINHDVKERIVELANGNPGATIVCIRLYHTCGSDALKLLSQTNLRGAKIWKFYLERSGQNGELGPERMLAELRKLIFESV